MEIGCSGTCCFSPRPCVRGAINTRSRSRFPGHLGCARVHTSARPAAPSRAAVLFMRSEGRRGAKVCKHSGPRGLDKARLRHGSDRAAMDTAESAERAHSPALPPPRSLCPPPAQPGYLSAGIHPLHPLSVPAGRGARGPPGPGSSPRTLHLSPRPVPAALALAQCPCSVLVVSCGRAHILFARGLRLPFCRSEGFWRPWLRTPGEEEEREQPRAADAVSDRQHGRQRFRLQSIPTPTPTPGLGTKAPGDLRCACPRSCRYEGRLGNSLQ